jgi:hypothetical protein
MAGATTDGCLVYSSINAVINAVQDNAVQDNAVQERLPRTGRDGCIGVAL